MQDQFYSKKSAGGKKSAEVQDQYNIVNTLDKRNDSPLLKQCNFSNYLTVNKYPWFTLQVRLDREAKQKNNNDCALVALN